MPRRLASFVFGFVVVLASMAALGARPAAGAPHGTADYVILAGVAGLRWEDVSPTTTPTLWRMAERGSIGSLSVRAAHRPTCPTDGWLTLGAGNYAAAGAPNPATACPRLNAAVQRPDGIGGYLPNQRSVVRYNQDKLPFGAVPGALAESVRCTVAVGPGAAVAAARPFGRVDRYEPSLPADPRELLASCVLGVVDLGVVAGEDPAKRAAAARQADAALARVLAARPERSLVLVAGLSDTDQTSRLHVAVADGPGWQGGWLTSPSTGRDGYLQLVDLAPTALAALGRPMPQRLFAGQPAVVVRGRPTDLHTAVNQPADADREAGAQRRVATWFFGLLAGVQLLLAIAVVPLLRRARRDAGPVVPTAVSPKVVATVEVLLVAAALAIPAALVADAVPWWRADHAGLIFAGVSVLVLAVATAVVRRSRPYRWPLGPMGLVAGLGAVVVGADVVTGARLQLNGVAGYSAIEGGRYAGLGTVGLGVFIAGTLLGAGCLAQQVRRALRPLVVLLVGGIGVIVVGSPYLGADAVGAVAMTAGVSVAAAISTGGWLTFARFAWATLAGLAVTAGFAVIEVRRPEGERGTLGRFLGALGDGTAGMAVHRVAASNVAALGSPLTVLAITGAVLAWFALLRPWGGLKRLFGLHPAVRAGMAGLAVAALIGGLFGGSGLNVAGAAAALTVPMAVLAALRVLDHAADRTLPPLVPDSIAVAGSAATADDSASPKRGEAPPGSAETPAADADTPAGDAGPPVVVAERSAAVAEPDPIASPPPRTPADASRTPGDASRTPGDASRTPADAPRTPDGVPRTPDDVPCSPADVPASSP